MLKLTVELVPGSNWGANLRSILKPGLWDKLRRNVYDLAGHQCEICGKTGRNGRVEAHEVWSYDDTRFVQKLEEVQALCPLCHQVKHIGRSVATGDADTFARLLKHMSNVNGWSFDTAADYVTKAFNMHMWRSRHEWQLDLDWIADHEEMFQA